jgi:hypothetical protein
MEHYAGIDVALEQSSVCVLLHSFTPSAAHAAAISLPKRKLVPSSHRVVHNAYRIELSGESLRKRHVPELAP